MALAAGLLARPFPDVLFFRSAPAASALRLSFSEASAVGRSPPAAVLLQASRCEQKNLGFPNTLSVLFNVLCRVACVDNQF